MQVGETKMQLATALLLWMSVMITQHNHDRHHAECQQDIAPTLINMPFLHYVAKPFVV
jgi:hypothetical protein